MLCNTRQRMSNTDRDDRRARLAAAGDWLRVQRERAGIPSPAELARRLSVDRSLVYNWENGKNAPRETIMAQLADQLGVTQDDVRSAYGLYVSESPGDSESPEDDEYAEIADEVADMNRRMQQLTERRHRTTGHLPQTGGRAYSASTSMTSPASASAASSLSAATGSAPRRENTTLAACAEASTTSGSRCP